METVAPDGSQRQRLQDRRQDDGAFDKGITCQGWHTPQVLQRAQHLQLIIQRSLQRHLDCHLHEAGIVGRSLACILNVAIAQPQCC